MFQASNTLQNQALFESETFTQSFLDSDDVVQNAIRDVKVDYSWMFTETQVLKEEIIKLWLAFKIFFFYYTKWISN